MILKNLAKCLIAMIIISVSIGCASKKYDTRLAGIQKQISYLTDTYNNLSMKLGEIQDNLLVVQSKMESIKSSKYSKSRKRTREIIEKDSINDPREKKKLPLERFGSLKKTGKNAEEDPEEVPIFELSAEKNELAGKPGEVFQLEGGSGYIKIEGAKQYSEKRNGAKIISSTKITPNQFYKQAYKQYSKRKFDNAIREFQNFLKVFPEHDLSDNAVYWIGESFVGKGNYALALPEFQRVPLDYPNGNKVPDSLLMIGICFDKLNNKENAKVSWKKLVMLFPKTMAAKKAKKKLETF